MSDVVSRFLNYVSIDTQSMDGQEQFPSTAKQLNLARLLAEELKGMGAANVRISDYGYVYAEIPPAPGCEEAPVLGFIAHMDTTPDFSGTDVKPQRISSYDGGDICLNRELDLWLRPEDFPELSALKGQDLITTDGTTLLGADDKAGVAEIMTMAQWFLSHPEEPHGPIRVAFTPDEEVGRGADFFDVEGFGADLAYTVDGGMLGELEYENFNAAAGKVTVQGRAIHPGSAKDVMVNAAQVATEYNAALPSCETPRYTEGYEGFFHLTAIAGTAERAELRYILRDHDAAKMQLRREMMEHIAKTLNERYGAGTVSVSFREQYRNMAEKIRPDYIHLVDNAVKATEAAGVTPLRVPIRGGTDGAQLSWEGLPCPNLGTGGYAFHGPYEHITVEGMDKCVEIIRRIVEIYA